MANGTKTYQLVINGVKESINAVESLNKQLDALESRLNSLSSKSVNVSSSSSSGGGGSRSGALSEEEKIQKQIAQTEEKRIAYEKQIYQDLLAQKDLLKETINDQKQVAAQERLTSDAYSNTMQGMKQKLADIKAVMQTVDLGDTDTFDNLTKEADKLNSKLLEIEKSYGQFGRQVGNYPIAAEGFKGLKITVGDTVQEFDSARQALKALKQEMQTLSAKKDMGIITEEESKRLNDLIPTVKELESSIQDAGKPMDAIMDNMQSIVALASAGKGIAAFFGLEDTGIEESIQKLVALQNVMTSIQTIQKQLQTGEGFGKFFGKGSSAIDSFTNKLFGVKKASEDAAASAQAQASATTVAASSSSAATTAANAQTAATNKLTIGMRAATIASRALSTALKAIGIGVVIYGITKAIDAAKSLINWLNGVDEEEEKIIENQRKIADAGAQAYAKANVEIKAYQQRIEVFNGTKAQELKLVDELNKKYGDALGTYKTLAEWKQALIDKSDAYIQVLKMEAEAQALLEIYTEAYKEYIKELDEIKSGKYDRVWYSPTQKMMVEFEKQMEATVKETSALNKYLEKLKEISEYTRNNNIFGYAPTGDSIGVAVGNAVRSLIKDNKSSFSSSKGGSGVDTVKKAEENINQMRLNVMREGLSKTIAQLTLERNKRIEEVKKNGVRVGEQEILINREYQQKILNARLQYHQKLLQEENAFMDEENTLQINNYSKETAWMKNAYDRRLEIAISALRKYPEAYEKTLNDYRKFEDEWNKEYKKNHDIGKIVDEYKDYLQLKDEEFFYVLDKLSKTYISNTNDLLTNGFREAKQTVSKGAEDMYLLINKAADSEIAIGQTVTEELDIAFKERIDARKEYYAKILELQKENAKKQQQLQNESLMSMLDKDMEAEEKRYRQLVGMFDKDVFRFNADAVKESSASMNPIQKALQSYLSLQKDNKTNAEIGKMLKTAREDVEEFINEVESAFANDLISFEEYSNTMNSTLLQSLVDAKNNYEDYYEKYNEMSKSEQENSLAELTHYQTMYYSAFGKFLHDLEIAQETHNTTVNVINNEFLENERKANFEYLKQVQNDTNSYFSNIENEYERAYKAISRNTETFYTQNRISSEYGFINIKQLKNDINAAKLILEERLKEIDGIKKELQNKLQLNEITEEDFSNQLDTFNNLSNNIIDELQNLDQKAKDSVDNLVSTINNYIQQIGQSIQTIMSAYNDYQDYLFDKQQEALEKENEQLQTKLKEQEDILSKHKNSVNDIENELEDARGDRRQHLIDQLNAEIQAQRDAAAEKKRIEKEQEALEKKQDALEKKRKEAEYKRNLASILVQGAMAVSSGLATAPFWPVGVAMGALATSLTAYQYAMAAKQKPYETGGIMDGGVAVGKRHKDGGIPVLGGKASIEGGEFITNRVSTSKNAPLLEFINSKKKTINLSDMIEFYSTKPRATIKNIKSTFADGGIINTASNADLSSTIDRTIIVKDNATYVVSVVDIMNKASDVRRVQTLAGIATN